jgi:photosynthetic reaction center cytochrome c subunit
MAASRQGQNQGSASVGYASLPYDPFTSLIGGNGDIRVLPTSALPLRGQSGATIQQTEKTYGLMMHFSNSLGVSCTFCHNSRNFHVWNEGPAQRGVAWYGIRMTRELNQDYLDPLQPVYPAQRLGPRGDAPKVNCSTCHQGIPKPLYGVAMAQDYPALGVASEMAEAPAASEAAADSNESTME